MVEKSPINSIIILAIAAVIAILALPVLAMSKEEIFYWYGVKATGAARYYEAIRRVKGENIEHPDSPFLTMEECRKTGYSCRFTLRYTFESAEEMNRRYNDFLRSREPVG